MAAAAPTPKETSKLGVHLLVVIFGITSWSIMNGLWVELPILVSHLPEGWTLPSYLTIISQFGNIGPLLFSFIVFLRPGIKWEAPMSVIIAVALTLCALMYSFFWKDTAVLVGENHSVALFGLTLTQSVFAATTSIAYVTFMAHLKARYMSSLFIGMGLSGLIPALAALGQKLDDVRCVQGGNTNHDVSTWHNATPSYIQDGANVSRSSDGLLVEAAEPSFSVRAFFLMLFGVGLMSVSSLLVLMLHPYCGSERVSADLEESHRLMPSGSTADSTAPRDIPSPASPDSTADFHSTRSSPQTSDLHTSNHPNKLTEFHQLPVIGETPNAVAASPPDVLTEERIDWSNFQLVSTQDLLNKDSQILNKDSQILNKDSQMSQEMVAQPARFASTSRHNKTGSSEPVVHNSADIELVEDTVDCILNKGTELTKLQSWYLLFLLIWINALQTSFVLAVQVYSSLPYGILFYNGATKAENIVDPIASFATFWLVASSPVVITGLALLGTLFAGYIIVVAALSPDPFLVDQSTVGGSLVIIAWILSTIFMVLSKVSIANVMRGQGRVSLMWTGASTQLGSLLGAILAYLTINVLHLFKDEPWCR